MSAALVVEWPMRVHQLAKVGARIGGQGVSGEVGDCAGATLPGQLRHGDRASTRAPPPHARDGERNQRHQEANLRSGSKHCRQNTDEHPQPRPPSHAAWLESPSDRLTTIVVAAQPTMTAAADALRRFTAALLAVKQEPNASGGGPRPPGWTCCPRLTSSPG
jgi:hypothetical protein